ncbi:hypothetical protein Hanom_Chr17g01555601 [Helianthus anomalus]
MFLSPLKNKFTLFLSAKNSSFALSSSYDFASYKFIILPLVFFSSQPSYNFALNLNLHFAHRFCLFFW